MLIYKITNKINGKIYIGQTKGDKDARFDKHCAQKNCIAIHNAIKKYGRENFTIDEIEKNIKTKKDLNDREIYYISYYNSTDPKIGYNICLGGEGGPIMTGKNHPNWGKSNPKLSELNKNRKGIPLSEDRKEKMSQRFSGPGNPRFGVALSEDTKNKISIGNSGKQHSESSKKTRSDRSKGSGNPNFGKSISDLVSQNFKKFNEMRKISIKCNETNETYSSMSALALFLGVTVTAISNHLNGKQKTIKGRTFSRIEVKNVI